MTELSMSALRVVRAVAIHGSFSAAARRLGYSQPAISRQAAAAEAAAGQALFERRARGVRLTRAGELVAEFASRTLTGLEGLGDRLEDLHGAPGAQIRVGAFPAAAGTLLPRAVARLAESRPGLKVTMTEGASPALLRQIAADRLDVAVVASGPGLPQVALVVRRRNDMVFFGYAESTCCAS